MAGFRERESMMNGNAALVGSSEPQALFIMILSVFLFGSSAFGPKDRKGNPAVELEIGVAPYFSPGVTVDQNLPDELAQSLLFFRQSVFSLL